MLMSTGYRMQRAGHQRSELNVARDWTRCPNPTALRMEGHNPLTLLHSALSEGLHAQSDEACLAIAEDIRVVLTEIAERISQSLREQAELTTAVSRLLSRRPASPSARNDAGET